MTSCSRIYVRCQQSCPSEPIPRTIFWMCARLHLFGLLRRFALALHFCCPCSVDDSFQTRLREEHETTDSISARSPKTCTRATAEENNRYNVNLCIEPGGRRKLLATIEAPGYLKDIGTNVMLELFSGWDPGAGERSFRCLTGSTKRRCLENLSGSLDSRPSHCFREPQVALGKDESA